MEIISSKVSLNLTTGPWRWLHESTWEDYHLIFASKCPCFSNDGVHRSRVCAMSKPSKNDILPGGFHPAGKWILENKDTKTLVMAANLQWEDAAFQSAWIAFSQSKDQIMECEEERNPIHWLLETLLQLLRPDVVTLSGDLPPFYWLKFSDHKQRIAVPEKFPQGGFRGGILAGASILKLDLETWNNADFLSVARQELGWVKKRAERAQKELQLSNSPKQRPFLLRFLLALSPVRRRRREKMIHPLHRYRSRLNQ